MFLDLGLIKPQINKLNYGHAALVSFYTVLCGLLFLRLLMAGIRLIWILVALKLELFIETL